MKDLIKKLENAEGPDRELDVAIGFAVGRIRERNGNYLLATGNDSDMVVEPNAYDDHLVAQPLSYYTSSVDAAMTLIPRHAQWTIETDAAWVRWLEGEKVKETQGWFTRREGKATALAVCIAALKAREAQTLDTARNR
jgi:hypothetical protein